LGKVKEIVGNNLLCKHNRKHFCLFLKGDWHCGWFKIELVDLEFCSENQLVRVQGVNNWKKDLEDKKKKVHLHSPTEGKCSKNDGAIAQSVEQRTENPCVAGSIPARTTEESFREIWSFFN
jgi:hypothetical protein